jgi:hypothetical protein
MDLNAQSKLQKEAAQRYAQEITPEALVALEERGISELVAAKFQLGTVIEPANGHEMHEGWLSIPYITALGHCVGFKFRRLNDGKPKYGSPTGQKAHLYNVSDVAVLSKHIVVCEGELDTVIVSGVLGIPAVGSSWSTVFGSRTLVSCYQVMTAFILLAIMILKRMALTQVWTLARRCRKRF